MDPFTQISVAQETLKDLGLWHGADIYKTDRETVLRAVAELRESIMRLDAEQHEANASNDQEWQEDCKRALAECRRRLEALL